MKTIFVGKKQSQNLSGKYLSKSIEYFLIDTKMNYYRVANETKMNYSGSEGKQYIGKEVNLLLYL